MSKVSIIIPSYNHRLFVEKTIQSVASQDYEDKEIIVIDDGSTDGSVELLQKISSNYNFKLITKSNEGICASLNRGISLAQGDFITFIASDDLMTPHRISEQVKFLGEHPHIDIVAGTVQVIDAQDNLLNVKKLRTEGEVSFDLLMKKNQIFAPTAMFRKTVFENYGLYDSAYAFEDYYMWLKVLKKGGRIFNVNKIWAKYRISQSNLEKRFNWYHLGNNQIFSDYIPDERALRRINHNQFVYSAKMTLLLGSGFFSKYRGEYLKLDLFKRAALRLTAFIPEFLRKSILGLLLRKM